MGRRRKKGNPVHGWVLIDKPAGLTSSNVVNKLRYLLDANRAGHAGTLDPDATGLLPVAFGEATKLLPYLENCPKTYEFEIAFGSETSTDDASGEVIAHTNARPTRAQIDAVIPQFLGDIMQVPPKVSALKIDGKRAYDLVRQGVDVELAARPLHMNRLELIGFSEQTARLIMTCGKGGYVRSIARDLARAAGSLGHVLWLRRLETSGFDVKDAVIYSEFLEMKDKFAVLHPIEFARADWPKINLSGADFEYIKNGRAVANPSVHQGFVFLSYNNITVAIGRCEDEAIEVERFFPQLAEKLDSPFSNS